MKGLKIPFSQESIGSSPISGMSEMIMKKKLICGIGNALVDSEYKVTDTEIADLSLTKGCMELNDRENHMRLLSHLNETHGTVKMMPGGSVANSLYTLSQFGVDASFIGRVSDDVAGDSFIKSLENVGIEACINQVDAGITGECLVLITPDHERTMYTHLGVSSDLDKDDIDLNMIKSSRYVLIEGYLVTSDNTKNVALHALDFATENGTEKIITLSDPNVIKFFRDNMLELLKKNFDMIFCNKQEALNISMKDNIEDAIDFLKGYSPEIIITSGDEGAYVVCNGERAHEIPESVSPVDLTGAGDMFLASYIFAKINQKNLSDCVRFANRCAGEVIQEYGAKLDSDSAYKRLYKTL